MSTSTVQPQKNERIDIRLSTEQKSILKEAADIIGEPLASYVISSALRDAIQLIRERNTITLSERDWKRLEEILTNNEGPSKNLLKAARRHRRLVEKSNSQSHA